MILAHCHFSRECIITHLEPVVPAERETKSRVDEAVGVSSETRGEWKPCSHLTKSGHDQVCKETDSGICDEEGTWTGSCKSRTTGLLSASVFSGNIRYSCYSRSDNKTSTDGTTDGNHSNLSRLETSVKVVLLIVLVVSIVMVSTILGGMLNWESILVTMLLAVSSNTSLLRGVVDGWLGVMLFLLAHETHLDGLSRSTAVASK